MLPSVSFAWGITDLLDTFMECVWPPHETTITSEPPRAVEHVLLRCLKFYSKKVALQFTLIPLGVGLSLSVPSLAGVDHIQTIRQFTVTRFLAVTGKLHNI